MRSKHDWLLLVPTLISVSLILGWFAPHAGGPVAEADISGLVGGYGYGEKCVDSGTVGCPPSGKDVRGDACQENDTAPPYCYNSLHDYVCIPGYVWNHCGDPGAGVCDGWVFKVVPSIYTATGFAFDYDHPGGCGAYQNCS